MSKERLVEIVDTIKNYSPEEAARRIDGYIYKRYKVCPHIIETNEGYFWDSRVNNYKAGNCHYCRRIANRKKRGLNG